jgi:hypothetical protein
MLRKRTKSPPHTFELRKRAQVLRDRAKGAMARGLGAVRDIRWKMHVGDTRYALAVWCRRRRQSAQVRQLADENCSNLIRKSSDGRLLMMTHAATDHRPQTETANSRSHHRCAVPVDQAHRCAVPVDQAATSNQQPEAGARPLTDFSTFFKEATSQYG